MKYKLLALDVDGTLIGLDQKVPPTVVDALADAEAAGLRICLATGRSYVETLPVWKQLRLRPPYQPMVLIGGALISEPDTGRTLFQRAIDRPLAFEYADALVAEGYSAMAIVDAWRHGVDYFFAHGPRAEHEAREWFWKMNVKIRSVQRLADAHDMPAPLRISAVVKPEEAAALEARMAARFGERLNLHAILAPNYHVTIVEAFAASCDKFRGVTYVAQALQIGPGAVAAVGDDVNDIPMLQHTGLGATVPAAKPEVKAAAKHVITGGLDGFVRDLMADKL